MWGEAHAVSLDMGQDKVGPPLERWVKARLPRAFSEDQAEEIELILKQWAVINSFWIVD